MTAKAMEFPVVLKPDVGERGNGVEVVRSLAEMERYLRRATGSVIVQRLVEGIECGIFYSRHPDASHGSIVSIAETRHPQVEGNGRDTLDELLRRQASSRHMLSVRRLIEAPRLREIPSAGQKIRLVELGFCSRKARYLDRCSWTTPALERSIEEISRAHPGFHFGRFDVYADSADALRRGQFKVIELNGVTAEATHMNDPAGTIGEAARVLRRQWRLAFEIGAANRSRGARSTPPGQLILLLWQKLLSHIAATTAP